MEIENKINVSNLTNVPETMLLPLCLKAKETRENGIIRDDKAVEIISKIDYDFTRIEKNWIAQISVAIRTYLFDKILRTESEKNEKLVVVNLGAGLDTRQERFPDLKWYQLDLPESLEIRKQFFIDDKTTFIPKSILDFSWIKDVEEHENVLFIGEGLFMFFSETEVKSVFERISKNFTNSFITFNTLHISMTGMKHAGVDTKKAPLKWGIQSIKEIEDWKLGWKLCRVYYPHNYHRLRWRWLGLLSLISPVKKGLTVALMQTV